MTAPYVRPTTTLVRLDKFGQLVERLHRHLELDGVIALTVLLGPRNPTTDVVGNVRISGGEDDVILIVRIDQTTTTTGNLLIPRISSQSAIGATGVIEGDSESVSTQFSEIDAAATRNWTPRSGLHAQWRHTTVRTPQQWPGRSPHRLR